MQRPLTSKPDSISECLLHLWRKRYTALKKGIHCENSRSPARDHHQDHQDEEADEEQHENERRTSLMLTCCCIILMNDVYVLIVVTIVC
jgi:hypothetical protein